MQSATPALVTPFVAIQDAFRRGFLIQQQRHNGIPTPRTTTLKCCRPDREPGAVPDHVRSGNRPTDGPVVLQAVAADDTARVGGAQGCVALCLGGWEGGPNGMGHLCLQLKTHHNSCFCAKCFCKSAIWRVTRVATQGLQYIPSLHARTLCTLQHGTAPDLVLLQLSWAAQPNPRPAMLFVAPRGHPHVLVSH